MFEHKPLQSLEEYFTGLSRRRENGVFICRIAGYNGHIRDFLHKYYDTANHCGVIIGGKIPNPDENQLSYYQEMMGMRFQMSMGFFLDCLKKWLPRMNSLQRENVAASVYDTLDEMRRAGKNENILKNTYIKFMCWLYYRFERIVNQLGNDSLPKILYLGDISNHELKMLSVLVHAGCDAVLLQTTGSQNYSELDPDSKLSDLYVENNMVPFPEGFQISQIRSEIEQEKSAQRLYGQTPKYSACTNTWVTEAGMEAILKPVASRGSDPNCFYNAFIRMDGVADRVTCLNELYQFQWELKKSGRNVLILEDSVPLPDLEETDAIHRGAYQNKEQLITGLTGEIRYQTDPEIQSLMRRAFAEVIEETASKEGMNLNRLTGKAVILACWIRRYQAAVFKGLHLPEVSCVVFLGRCQNENEANFFRFLASLPADVLLLNTAKEMSCLADGRLLEIEFPDAAKIEQFPDTGAEMQVGTAAYHAERELDSVLYQESGLYRNRQYAKATAIILKTMYEEIAILWDQELKYRPSFSILDEVVHLPVIFAKVSGVKDKAVPAYWNGIKALNTPDTFLIKKAPFIRPLDANPVKAHVSEFFRNGRLQKEVAKGHKAYQYAHLREDIQDYILDKLQLLIDLKLIRGTFENGTEYTVVSTVLNLNKEIVRLLQNFDFTKKNPKLIYINTAEETISLEDSIMTAFLSLAGFDVLFFVPTGYQSVEKYFQKDMLEEHQIGEYVYDLQPPDLDVSKSGARQLLREKIFKRGV